jgi:hypothetical protein
MPCYLLDMKQSDTSTGASAVTSAGLPHAHAADVLAALGEVGERLCFGRPRFLERVNDARLVTRSDGYRMLLVWFHGVPDYSRYELPPTTQE